ncbi:MAG: RidA family protein [Candidatus Delongbacteria bacterium]|nr:RidA family protein [Candidatus Delongbacteria bacterium]MCG2760770.1 RidA family protein [Candidatus Delongbacteria bacterium]
MKRIIISSKAPKAVGAYSQAVEKNGMLFVSGQVALKPKDNVMVEGGIVEQTTQVLENIKAILNEAGYTFDDIVKCTCLLTDLGNFKEFNIIYSKYFDDEPPARVTCEVCSLPIGALVEIDCIAVK